MYQSPIPWHFVPCVVCLTVVISSAVDLQLGEQGSQSESSVIPRINPATSKRVQGLLPPGFLMG